MTAGLPPGHCLDMQPQNQNVVVQPRSDLDKQSESVLIVSEYLKSYRLMRALKALGICWAIALVCILVPILHFVLVPAFFLAGIFMFFMQMGIHFHLISGQIQCPSCDKDMPLKPGAFDWPKREICVNCRADLTINKKS